MGHCHFCITLRLLSFNTERKDILEEMGGIIYHENINPFLPVIPKHWEMIDV